MAIQVPSDLLAELLRLEREKSKIMALAEAWGLETLETEEIMREEMKRSIKKASGF
jgi:hypothetical protein